MSDEEFFVRLQFSEKSSRRMPFDSAMGRDLADALAEVRTAFEREDEARRGRFPLAELQPCINHRKAMQERAMLLFKTILDGIPAYCAESPIVEKRRGRPDAWKAPKWTKVA